VKPKFSEDAEKGLLCSLILGGDRVAVEVSVPKEAFYIPAHRIIWESLLDLIAEKRRLEFPIVKHRLEQLEMLEEIGGAQFLSELYGFIPSWEGFADYAQTVVKYHRIRNARVTVGEMESILDGCGQTEWPLLREELGRKFFPLYSDDGHNERPLGQQMAEWWEYISTLQEKLASEGIGFGLPSLDERLGMQQPGELVVLGAPTSAGKSLLVAQGLGYNMIERGLDCALVSLEMTEKQILSRLASHHTKISMELFRKPNLFTPSHSAKLTAFYEMIIKNGRFHFRDDIIDIDAITSWARQQRFRHGIKLLAVDYLQAVQAGPRRYASRESLVAEIASALKSLAKELGIVIWCPVQLNKEAEVRESAAISFYSDISLKLLLDGGATLVIDKMRQGSCGKPIPVTVRGETQTIEERKKPAKE
jgi:replicative DNA helicase